MVLFFILLGAAIIGFVVAWLMYRSRFLKMKESLGSYQTELSNAQAKLNQLDRDNITILAENNALQMELQNCREVKQMVDEPQLSPFGEVSEVHRQNADRLGFKVHTGGQKDDLKLIHGVGPFIEKKLNALGIFTFEQISDFNLDTINKVNEAIEYFPGRIERDHWVDQAKKLKG